MATDAAKIVKSQAMRQSISRLVDALYNLSIDIRDSPELFLKFKMRCKSLDRWEKDFDKHHNTVISLIASVDQAEELLLREHEIAQRFMDQVADIHAVYYELFDLPEENNLSSSNSAREINETQQTNVSLPKISLPLFDGDIKKFPTFFELFSALIHNNRNLSNIEKFHYLLSSLTGTPLALVKCTPLLGDNYNTAITVLQSRYNNKRLLATAYWREIERAPVTNYENVQSLQNILEVFNLNLCALKNLNFPVDGWDFILMNMLLDRLDVVTLKDFELSHASTDIPTYKEVFDFLTKHCNALETMNWNSRKSKTLVSKSKQKSSFFTNVASTEFNNSGILVDETILESSQSTNVTECPNIASTSSLKSTVSPKCILCNKEHILFQCSSFSEKTPKERFNFVKTRKACINCLASSHFAADCTSQKRCRLCNKKHHTLLHFENSEPSVNKSTSSATNPKEPFSGFVTHRENILLGTVILNLWDKFGYSHQIRGLIDSGSQVTFLRKDVARKLNLKISNMALAIHGLNNMCTNANIGAHFQISPVDENDLVFDIDAVLVDEICGKMPLGTFSVDKWPHIKNLSLADPSFSESGQIDILLGADIFPLVLKDGIIPGGKGTPSAINTIFGWVLMGKVESCLSSSVQSFLASVDVDLECSLDADLKRFWEIEEVPNIIHLSPEADFCEKYFESTTIRDHDGRFVVHLPFKINIPDFGDSRAVAQRRFYLLERRLAKNLSLCQAYSAVIRDYLEQGHIERVPSSETYDLMSGTSFYLPHSCVYKESSSTPIRVVWDASSHVTGKMSLNDILFTGKKLQNDIVALLMNFRCYKYVFTTDIRQMYRMIKITDNHRNFLRLFWRFHSDMDMGEYRLTTLPFGLVCSPYLAIRCLQALTDEYKAEYPLATEVLLSSCYIDDILGGHDSVETVLSMKSELIALLAKAGFELRKWSSNNLQILSDLPAEHLDEKSLCLDLENSSQMKVLGLQWNPVLDYFSYSFSRTTATCTKRLMLSEIARVYDPLGFISPVLIVLKILIQELWSQKLGWDDIPPEEITTRFAKWHTEMHLLSQLKIQRHVDLTDPFSIQLLGFCDASMSAYCAVVYLRVENRDGSIRVFLVGAKTKVAPLKTISLPRLELCAAVLLSKWMKYVSQLITKRVKVNQVYCWTDSSVVLSWIRSSPHRWQTFVANRITYIQDNISSERWHHIPSERNPADVGSRGVNPEEFLSCHTWFQGPRFLKSPVNEWEYISSEFATENEIEHISLEQKRVTLTTEIQDNHFDLWLDHIQLRFSLLTKILNTICYVLCFTHNLKNPTDKWYRPFSANIIHKSLLLLARRVQSLVFKREKSLIVNKMPVTKQLQKLNLFIDDFGLIRVGSRLIYAELQYDKKFPILLPRDSLLTRLMINHFHITYLHAGVNTTFYLVSQMFWIISAKKLIRKVISKCRTCWKCRPISYQPPMGNLPSFRISKIKPFSIVGVDLGGPFSITMNRLRGSRVLKSYICLFICCATKAIHIELLSDLSRDVFLAGFRRFIARRGRCSQVISDCGTNFVASAKYLRSLVNDLEESEKITWKFNPPSAPHMGGLWEGGIKSIKKHLIRVIGQQVLSYEEFYTLLTQIEAVLNSRPLCPISTDPNDLRSLTPGHFLTLEPLSAFSEPDLHENISISRLTRWQLVEQLHRSLWIRWKNEYLQTLHQRAKWNLPATDIVPGTMVVIKNELEPPLKWRLGRIVTLHPGGDGVPRVATVRTNKGLLTRPLVKLCPLPNE